MKDNKNNDKWLCNLLWAAAFVFLIMFISALCVFKCIGGWEQRGQFGDLFGVVNALFSGLAFAGLIITIRQQHQDLEYQKQAIEQTNQEMRSQTKEFDKQNETLRIERFENTFFKMLEVQQGIVNDFYEVDTYKQCVEEDSPDHHGKLSKEVPAQYEYRGRNAFYYLFCRCDYEIENYHTPGTRLVGGLREVIRLRGLGHFNDYVSISVFDHYFRHLYTILKFITENDWLGEKAQYQYATFVRATLSRYELVMLYYNGLFHPKMKKMMERYCLLNNIRKRLLPMSRECYDSLENKGIDKEEMYNAGFSKGDFEFYLTDDKNDVSKYYLGAFYTPNEMSDGQALLERWRQFVNSKS